MGRPLPGYRIELLDIDEQSTSEGEIAVLLDPCSLALMLGHEGDDENTADAIRTGRYRTGDTGDGKP
jgi:acetyl-CoA synthetase